MQMLTDMDILTHISMPNMDMDSPRDTDTTRFKDMLVILLTMELLDTELTTELTTELDMKLDMELVQGIMEDMELLVMDLV